MRMASAAIGLAGGLLVLAGTLLWKFRADMGDRWEAGTSRPVRLSGLSPLDMTAETYSRWGAVLAKFHPGPDLEPSAVAHYLRFWAGATESPGSNDPSCALTSWLLDDGTCLDWQLPKQKVLRRHSRGIRYELSVLAHTPGLPPIIPGERHVGQCLSALGEAGVSPDQEVFVDGRTYHVRDLIEDVAWCYTFDDEIEWRTVALALYRPQVAEWRTKNGRKVSWAMITDEFVNLWLRRKMSGHACAGTHVLYVLALLTKVDAVHPLWSGSRRAAVDRCLRDAAGVLAITQRSDGHWDTSWSDPEATPPAADPLTDLLITGHHLEWLALRPEGRRPPAHMIRSAGGYLVELLSSWSAEDIRKVICHASHGVRAYRLAGIRVQ